MVCIQWREMSDNVSEEERLRAAVEKYKADGERIRLIRAAAEEERRRERSAALQRARASGLRFHTIVAITGWSTETVRQALNPAAYDKAHQARTQRRRSNSVHTDDRASR